MSVIRASCSRNSADNRRLRFAYLQTGEVFILATGGIVNFGLQQLNGSHGLAGWRWIYLVQGSITAFLGVITFFWMVEFPENGHRSFWFLTPHETAVVVARIDRDRGDVMPSPFSWRGLLAHSKDPKAWGFACMFFCQNVVSTALSYFLPLILQDGLGYSTVSSLFLDSLPLTRRAHLSTESVNTTVSPSLLLGYCSSDNVLFDRRSSAPTWGCDSLQLSLPHSRHGYARVRRVECGPLHRHLSRYRGVCEQLGGHISFLGFERCWAVEESILRRIDHCIQRGWRHRRQFYFQAA